MKLITTADAAASLGVHRTRVQVLIREGRLPAQMIGGTYIINDEDLALVAERKTGRPKKANGAEAIEAMRVSAPVKAKPGKKRAAKKVK
jgi:excisionase family DNA binding protein